jgi:hypothetical protein
MTNVFLIHNVKCRINGLSIIELKGKLEYVEYMLNYDTFVSEEKQLFVQLAL